MEKNSYARFRKLSPKVTGGLVRMRQETFRDAAVVAKYKVLAALAIVVVTKCEPCIKAYAKMAYQLGMTQEELLELLEFLNVDDRGRMPESSWCSRRLRSTRN